jgi:DNA-binding XRE family transcriptional regulator
MDAVMLWPALIKRLRFLSSLKQCELAQQLGVDQGTVSRWERGVYVPDNWVQKRLRDRLHRLEPAIEPAAVEAMPVIAILYDSEHIGLCRAASCSMANTVFHRRPDQMRSQMIRKDWSESVCNMWETFTTSDAWKSNNVAFGVATLLRPDRRWGQFTMMPVGGAPLLLATGGKELPPPDDLSPDDFKLAITTKDELCH